MNDLEHVAIERLQTASEMSLRYKNLYIQAFDKMLMVLEERRKMQGSWRMGATGQEVFNWWMEYDILPGQIDLFEDMEDEEWNN